MFVRHTTVARAAQGGVFATVNIALHPLDFRITRTTQAQKNGQPLRAAHVLNVLFRLPMSTTAAVSSATAAADVSTTASAVIAASATTAGARR